MRSLVTLLCLGVFGPISAATAQDTSTVAADQADKDSTQQKKENPHKSANKPVGFKMGNHPSLRIGSALKLDLAARFESDVRSATPAVGLDPAEMQWQDRRVGVEGTAFKRFEFELAREFRSNKPPWRDAYVNLHAAHGFEIEAGRFKLPFGRDELTGEKNLDFVYRSLAASALSPGRDTGVMAHGRVLRQWLDYQVGYFTRDGDNARTTQTRGSRDALAARAVLSPFAKKSKDAPLEIGMAIAQSRLDDQLGLRGESVFGDGVFFDRVYVNGRRTRRGLDAAWASGPVSLSSEFIVLSDERKSMGFNGDDLPSVRSRAWYVAGTWALTGERKHGRLEPRHDLLRGGMGAVELAARLENLRFESLSFPGIQFGFPTTASTLSSNGDRAATVGLNWYLNYFFKIQSNLIIESIADPQRSPAPSASGRFVSGVVRLQFVL